MNWAVVFIVVWLSTVLLTMAVSVVLDSYLDEKRGFGLTDDERSDLKFYGMCWPLIPIVALICGLYALVTWPLETFGRGLARRKKS